MHFRHNVWVSRTRTPSSSRQHRYAVAAQVRPRAPPLSAVVYFAQLVSHQQQRTISSQKCNRSNSLRQTRTRKYRPHNHVRQFSVSTLDKSQDVSFEQNQKSSFGSQPSASARTCLLGAPNEGKLDIAVLGGGITGLATTYFLAQKFPNAVITLIEKQPTLGGWIQTKTVRVPGGEIMFEQGPRTLRPSGVNGKLMLNVIRELGLVDELLVTPKSSPAAGNRFIYYPDHLVRLGVPKSLGQFLQILFREPLTKGIIGWGLNDFRADARNPSVRDESIGEFLSRRLGRGFVDRIASAGLHGIYAGDIWNLSARSVMPSLWYAEEKFQGFAALLWSAVYKQELWGFCDDLSLYMHVLLCQPPILLPNPKTGNPVPFEKLCSVYTLKRGLGQLSEAFEKRLRNSPNVELLQSTTAAEIRKISSKKIQMTFTCQDGGDHGGSQKRSFDQVISTINPRTLHQMMPKETFKTFESRFLSPCGPSRAEPHAVTVMVVNIYFKTPLLLTKINPPGGLPAGLGPEGLRGFGYLIPGDLPYEQNPECALGVIFDSDISKLHSTVPPASQGTKLTMMMGGHFWDGMNRFPTPSEATAQALAVLHRHLGISEDPIATNATLQQECIPQYEVGHSERMEEAHHAYLEAYNGLLKVAGSWYTGVGVNDCVRAGYEIVRSLDECVSPKRASEAPPDRTGLRQFTSLGRPMMKYRLAKPAPGSSDPILIPLEVEAAAKKMGYFDP